MLSAACAIAGPSAPAGREALHSLASQRRLDWSAVRSMNRSRPSSSGLTRRTVAPSRASDPQRVRAETQAALPPPLPSPPPSSLPPLPLVPLPSFSPLPSSPSLSPLPSSSSLLPPLPLFSPPPSPLIGPMSGRPRGVRRVGVPWFRRWFEASAAGESGPTRPSLGAHQCFRKVAHAPGRWQRKKRPPVCD